MHQPSMQDRPCFSHPKVHVFIVTIRQFAWLKPVQIYRTEVSASTSPASHHAPHPHPDWRPVMSQNALGLLFQYYCIVYIKVVLLICFKVPLRTAWEGREEGRPCRSFVPRSREYRTREWTLVARYEKLFLSCHWTHYQIALTTVDGTAMKTDSKTKL
jgi:hypothetical protein